MNDWPYDPASISARWIVGVDGLRKLQLRLDLGILQMEPRGRPDNTRPHGADSLLDHYLAAEEAAGGDLEAFQLDNAACGELQQEAAQYYYRYTALYALRDLEGVLADTGHNLGILELIDRRAEDDDVAWQFLQFFPYIRMMHARAGAELASGVQDYEAAITALEEGISDIRSFWSENGEDGEEASSRELELLADLLGDIRGTKPKGELDRLHEELTRAISTENYEKAALLRDAITAFGRRA